MLKWLKKKYKEWDESPNRDWNGEPPCHCDYMGGICQWCEFQIREEEEERRKPA